MKNLAKTAMMALILIVLSPTAFAHMGATGVVKERMESMKAIGGAMKVIAAQAKGETAFDKKAIRKAAGEISAHANGIVALFPDTKKSRHAMVSEARQAIWERPEEFAALAQDLADRSDELASRTDLDLGAVKSAMPVIAQSCKQCHEGFRAEK